jgi:hypothetical protein
MIGSNVSPSTSKVMDSSNLQVAGITLHENAGNQ